MKVIDSDRKERATIRVKTKADSKLEGKSYKWWMAGTQKERAEQTVSTASFLKTEQQYRYRQAGVYSLLYGNMPIFNMSGSFSDKFAQTKGLPIDRPTMNVAQSCVDTLVARITQSRPRPIFLTDNSDYKQRNLAKQLNGFIVGELYQTKAYELGELLLRDAAVLGTGCVKVHETQDKKVGLDRVLLTELLVDPVEALYGNPRQLFQLKLVDRSVLIEGFPKYRSDIEKAEQAYPDSGSSSAQTISDQVMVVEAWHLPSGKDAGDGVHIIATTAGLLLEEPFEEDTFPFVFLHYSPRLLGFWGQGLCEQLLGTQIEINKLLITISQAINLVGVPRVFVEDGSKVVKAHFNNSVGSIITFRGTKPIYEVAPCMPAEVYEQLQRLIQYAYQQSGISSLAAMSQKPAGLNSGEALRNYDDIQSDRFAALVRRYDNCFVDLSYKITNKAREIAERDGKYQTIYPNKDGTREVDLPAAKLIENPFVIQCFDASSLPRDPAGRLEKVTEMAQAGMISMQEARRLLDYPDLEQVDKLANAPEEHILQTLDDIVESGTEAQADEFTNLALAEQLTVQYINLYGSAKLEESKMQKLRDYMTSIQTVKQAAMPPAPPPMPAGQPPAVPAALPTSPLLPQVPQG